MSELVATHSENRVVADGERSGSPDVLLVMEQILAAQRAMEASQKLMEEKMTAQILSSQKELEEKMTKQIRASQKAVEEKVTTQFDEVLATILGKLTSQEESIHSLEKRVTACEKHFTENVDSIGGQTLEDLKGTVAKTFYQLQERMKRECQIRITGLEEEGDGHNLEEKVRTLFEQQMGVHGAGKMVVDAFRVGKKESKEGARPRAVIVRTGSQGQRNTILRGKRNLAGCKGLGVDIDRTKEEVEEFKKELQKKKEIEQRGGKARWDKGKVVEVSLPKARDKAQSPTHTPFAGSPEEESEIQVTQPLRRNRGKRMGTGMQEEAESSRRQEDHEEEQKQLEEDGMRAEGLTRTEDDTKGEDTRAKRAERRAAIKA
jgi:hypothetical protein